MREIFVYYRVDIGDVPAWRRLVHDAQASLMARYPPLRARCLIRPESKDGQQTCMEAYATDPTREPGGVSGEWQAAVEWAAIPLAPLLRSPRHVEVFEACG